MATGEPQLLHLFSINCEEVDGVGRVKLPRPFGQFCPLSPNRTPFRKVGKDTVNAEFSKTGDLRRTIDCPNVDAEIRGPRGGDELRCDDAPTWMYRRGSKLKGSGDEFMRL